MEDARRSSYQDIVWFGNRAGTFTMPGASSLISNEVEHDLISFVEIVVAAYGIHDKDV